MIKLTAKFHQLTESNLAQIQWQDCEHSCGSAHGAWLLLSRTGKGTWGGSSGYLAALLLRLLTYSPEHHFCHLEKKKEEEKLFSGIFYSSKKDIQVQYIPTFNSENHSQDWDMPL